jgi:predicted nuclease of predicted toxin-antitoxin system
VASVKFKLDENLPVEAADMLRSDGHDAQTVHDEHLHGVDDANIAAVCIAEARTIVTLDLDFSDIRAYPPADYSGIVVLRLVRQDRSHVVDALRRIAPMFQSEPLVGRLWIVTEDRVRIRESG